MAVAAALALGALMTGPGASLAGPRIVSFASPGAPDGEIRFSPGQAGDSAIARLVVTNLSVQTLTNVRLALGAGAPTAGAPYETSLPAGATVREVTGANAGSCTISADGLGLACAFGNLASGESRAIQVAINLGVAPPDPFQVYAAVTYNEGIQNNNVDTWFAAGTVRVLSGADAEALYFPAGAASIAVATGLGANGQTVKVVIPRAGATDLVAIEEGAFLDCAALGYTCAGDGVRLFVNFGDTIDPYADVTLTYPNGTRITQVLHLHDDGTLVVIPTKKNDCSATNTENCVVSYKNAIVVVRVRQNGVMRG